jgi:hypothetical protein
MVTTLRTASVGRGGRLDSGARIETPDTGASMIWTKKEPQQLYRCESSAAWASEVARTFQLRQRPSCWEYFGLCPRCGHTTSTLVPGAGRSSWLGARVRRESTKHQTSELVVICECTVAHDKAETGCGAYGKVIGLADALAKHGISTDDPWCPAGLTSSEATPRDLSSQLTAEKAYDDALPAIRATAEKWQAAIAGTLGLFTLSGLIKGPSDFAAVDAFWQPLIPALLLAAAASGGFAMWLAAAAAYSPPVWKLRTGKDYAVRQVRSTAAFAADLRVGIALALVSWACLAATVGVLWFAPRARTPAASLELLTTPTRVVCGELKAVTAMGVTIADQLSSSDVVTPLSDIRLMQTTSVCPH